MCRSTRQESEAETELEIDDAVAGLGGFEDACEGGGLAEEGRGEDVDGLRGVYIVGDILAYTPRSRL